MGGSKHANDSDQRDAIDALADRVDMLASIVRETAGSLSASRGEVASLDRRVQERIGEDTQRSAAALASVRSEIEALRTFVAEAPARSETVVVAASDPLKETVSTLAERVETLGEVVRSTAGRLVAEEGRIAILTEALEKRDERAEARFSELSRNLHAVSETAAQAARAAAAPQAPAQADPELERRVDRRVGELAERVDFLSGTVRESTSKLASRDGDIAKVEDETKRALASANETVRALRLDMDSLKERLAVDPLLQERVDGLVDTVQALGDRIGTLSGIVGETAGRRTGREPEIAAIDERLGAVGTRIDDVARELRHEIDALAGAVAAGGTDAVGVTPEIERQVAAFGEKLARLEVVVEDASGAADHVGTELRKEINALAEAVQRERVDLDLATSEWEARRADLDAQMRELSAFASSQAEASAHTAERALEQSQQAVTTSSEMALAVRADLDALKERLTVDPMLEERVDDLVGTVQALGDRVGALSGIAEEAAGRGMGRESEIAALDERLGAVGTRIDTVARELRREMDALASAAAGGVMPVVNTEELEQQVAAFGAQLARLEVVVEDASGAADQVGQELRDEITALGAAVAQERVELDQATSEWEARRADLEERMDELAAFTTSTAERGADEMGRALHTLADRLERLENDRRTVTSDATEVESTWALERIALEERLDAIAASITEDRPQAPEVGLLIDELARRLARMEDERETVADLAALAEDWAAELAALEARVDEGLSTLESHGGTEDVGPTVAPELTESLQELTSRIEQIERDRDVVREELTRTATSWATERASLQERVSELAARIVTGPMPAADSGTDDDGFAQSPQELDRLRIGIEGLRMRLAYHEKTVSDLAGSRGVVQRLDELTARLDQLAAIVAAGYSAGGFQAAAPRVQVPGLEDAGTAGLMSRLEEAERLRNETREKMLDQMEKIASRMDWRLQRLEAAGIETPAGVN